MKGLIKLCPFCGSPVRVRIGMGGLHFFYCTNRDECGAIVSFHGGEQGSEAENPIRNWNKRILAEKESIGTSTVLH